MKKMFVSLVLIILLSGCTVDYNLEIFHHDFLADENIYVYEGTINSNFDELINNLKLHNGQFYDISVIDDVSDYCLDENGEEIPNCNSEEATRRYGAFLYKRYYLKNDFENSKAINDFFGKTNFFRTGTVTKFSASPDEALGSILDNVNFFEAIVDVLNINIYIPYEIVNHNADRVEDNTYTWTFNKDNYKDKTIEISYDESKSIFGEGYEVNINQNQSQTNINTNINSNEKEESNNLWMILGIVVGGIIIIALVYFIRKNNNNNAI